MDTKNTKIDDFLDSLSSSSPTPGGGSAAALSAALAVSLALMVCSLTAGKKRYAAVEKDIKLIADKANYHKNEFIRFSDEDQKAFLPLAEAFAMPKSDEPQINERSNAVQRALSGAAQAPLSVLRRCAEAAPLFKELLEKGSRLMVSDVGTGALLLLSAAESAALNVAVNTRMMDDRKTADALDKEADSLLRMLTPVLTEVSEAVKRRLKA